MSNHAKEWGCVPTSLKRGGFKQLKIACSRPYCRRFSVNKSGARNDLVSSLITTDVFAFSKQQAIQLLFVLENPPFSF